MAKRSPRGELRSLKQKTNTEYHYGHAGGLMARERPRRGGRPGALTISKFQGHNGITCDPSVSFAYYLRAAMKPRQIAPVVVTDAAGNVIAHIVTDPVTGERTRRNV